MNFTQLTKANWTWVYDTLPPLVNRLLIYFEEHDSNKLFANKMVVGRIMPRKSGNKVDLWIFLDKIMGKDIKFRVRPTMFWKEIEDI